LDVLLPARCPFGESIEPDIHHGDACIKGTRIPVTTIVGSLADGLSHQEIIHNYPQQTEADIQAALAMLPK
jgi:uncharacterized protein (DUF433 family)